MGGLANNLFQIACVYAYSLKNDKEVILLKEKIGVVHNNFNTFELSQKFITILDRFEDVVNNILKNSKDEIYTA